MSGWFYTGLLAFATVFSWLAFFSLIFFISPVVSGRPGVIILNASLLIALTGTFALARIGFIYARSQELALGTSRYYFFSFWISAFFIAMINLSRAGLISPRNVLIVLLIFIVIAFLANRELSG